MSSHDHSTKIALNHRRAWLALGLGTLAALGAAALPAAGAARPRTSHPGGTLQIADLALPHQFPARGTGTLGAEDRLDILEIDARFNLAVDSRHFDALADLLAEDVVLDHQWGHRKGRAAAIALIKDHEPAEKNIRHQNTNHVVRANADGTVTVTSYLLAVRVDGGPAGAPAPYIIAHGLLSQRLRKEDGRWRIFHMVLDQTSVSSRDLPSSAARRHDAATSDVRKRLDGRAP